MENLLKKYGTNKLAEVAQRVEDVKSVMRDNVDKTLENVERLEDLETKSENIKSSAKQFEKNASNVKSTMRWRYIKMTMIIVVLLAIVIGIIVAAIMARR